MDSIAMPEGDCCLHEPVAGTAHQDQDHFSICSCTLPLQRKFKNDVLLYAALCAGWLLYRLILIQRRMQIGLHIRFGSQRGLPVYYTLRETKGVGFVPKFPLLIRRSSAGPAEHPCRRNRQVEQYCSSETPDRGANAFVPLNRTLHSNVHTLMALLKQ